MKRNILTFVVLILIATSFKYRSKTQAGILNPDSRVIIEQTTNAANDPALRLRIETDEIRSIENQEANAFIKGDTASLFQLWSADLVVTNPDNSIENLSEIKNNLMKQKLPESPFNRVIEKITLTGNVAIVMGYETMAASNTLNKPEKISLRRYTNIWIKNNNDWKLTARQATNTLALK